MTIDKSAKKSTKAGVHTLCVMARKRDPGALNSVSRYGKDETLESTRQVPWPAPADTHGQTCLPSTSGVWQSLRVQRLYSPSSPRPATCLLSAPSVLLGKGLCSWELAWLCPKSAVRDAETQMCTSLEGLSWLVLWYLSCSMPWGHHTHTHPLFFFQIVDLK